MKSTGTVTKAIGSNHVLSAYTVLLHIFLIHYFFNCWFVMRFLHESRTHTHGKASVFLICIHLIRSEHAYWLLVVRIAINESDENHDTAEATEIAIHSSSIWWLRSRRLRRQSTFHIFVGAIRRRTIHDAILVELTPNAESFIFWIATHQAGTGWAFCERRNVEKKR